MELKTAPHSTQNLFSKKSNLKFCIINLISFTNAQGSVKLRLACSKVLFITLITVIGKDILIKDKNYFFFINVDAANALLK